MHLVANENPHLSASLEAWLGEHAPEIRVTWLDADGNAPEPIADADIFFRFDMRSQALITALRQMPRLRWLHTGSAGVDTFLSAINENAPAEMIITNGAGAMARPIAEYVLAQMLNVSKGLYHFARAQTRHEWLGHLPNSEAPHAFEVGGARVLVLGMGHIGREIAKLCAGVGMRVWGVKREPPAEAAHSPTLERVFGIDEDWRGLLPAMDFVVISMPLTDATNGLISTGELAAIRSTGWLINIARGAIIDEPALVTALNEQRIGGAVLDVTMTEPLPASHPLWDCPTAIITPHISWRSPAIEERSMAIFFDNLSRYRAGEPLRNVVSRTAGY